MSDRVLGEVGTILVDLPGVTAGVSLTLINPYGDLIADVEMDGNPHGRYSYTPDDPFNLPGTWVAGWVWDDTTYIQRFTVGPRLGYASSLYDLRIDTARRVVEVHEGWIYDAKERSFSDPTLLGGSGEHVGYWIVTDPSGPNRGRVFMVTEFNGSSLTLSAQFWELPADGTPYVMFQASPREIDRAIVVAIKDLVHLARLPLTLTNTVVDADGLILLPDELTHVHEVWVSDGAGGFNPLRQTEWDIQPGRRLRVTTAEAAVTLSGLAGASVPLWDNSLVDLGPAVVTARAAMQMHANRASSSTTDLDEHLRRQLAAHEEYSEQKRTEVGRIPPGSRKVIE